MALYHLSVKQIKRSTGQSAIAAAAYRAGENLHSEYYGEDSDYTKKKGVITADILLPPHAPAEYKDRETLWNAVEQVEEHPKAQLAYSFDIALQNEFTMDENIELAKRFVTEQFVSRGMVADFAVHTPDKGGENPNPHFHVLCPIRPLNEDGTWGNKQRREYLLDEHGSRIPDGKGDYLFKAVPTTDWGRPETLEAWRKAWADLCNAKFEEKGLSDRIDSRSYERQGIDQIPTVHKGPNVRQMEQRGIFTDKGDLNRWIRRTNQLRQRIRKLLAELSQRIREISEMLTAPREQTLTELVTEYYTQRSKDAWSNTAKVGNLKSMSQMVNYLQRNGATNNYRPEGAFFDCSLHWKHKGKCPTHYIRESVLERMVLKHMQLVTGYILRYEDHFRSVMESQLRVESAEKLKIVKGRLERNEKRIAELKRLFIKIYEDNACGKLNDERFDMLSQSYEAEQKQLEAEATQLQQGIEVQQRQNENIEKFIQKAKGYVGIEKLDPYALRELVQAIYVDAPDKSGGKRRQHIHIKYDGIGFIPLNELMQKETA